MLKRFIPLALLVAMLTVSPGLNVYAASGSDEPRTVSVAAPAVGTLKTAIDARTKTNVGDARSTLADYEREKKAGRRFSTSTKVLIGVGIAAAVVGVVVFAASRDKIRTF